MIGSIVTRVISNILGAVGSGFLTYLVAKYFIAGMALERGYEAIGGEFILFIIIFFGLYYSLTRVFEKVIDEFVEAVQAQD